MKRATEPRRTPEQHAQVAALLKRLRTTHTLEVQARAEVDRLLILAWKSGVTDHTIADAIDVSLDTARMRRRRNALRRRPDRSRTRLPADVHTAVRESVAAKQREIQQAQRA